jgi:uncharacterized protein
MTWWDIAFLPAVGVVGGLSGSIAGLASIATYPALLVVGLPPVTANVTNTVAMVFTAIGSVWGSRPELKGQGPWLKRILPVAAVAGAIGAALLLSTPAEGFEKLVPILLGGASIAIAPSPWAWSRIQSGKSPAAHRHRAVRVNRDFCDLHLRRLFRCRRGRVADRAASPCRPREAGHANASKNIISGIANTVAAVISHSSPPSIGPPSSRSGSAVSSGPGWGPWSCVTRRPVR